jgi:deoxyribose-phosphate aldolase
MTDRWTVETITEEKVAKTIDHSLLRPELTLEEVLAGCALAAAYQVASVCCRPLDVDRCAGALEGTGVLVGTVVGFPHGGSTTAVKVAEAERALDDGAAELDMVLPIGWLRSGEDAYVHDDIAAVVAVARPRGAIVKVILENAYLTDDEKVRGCRLAEAAGADFVKTSTGFAPSGATHADLALMRSTVSDRVQVKAAGGVRTLDDLLAVMSLGVTRIGATQTKSILDDYRSRRSGAARSAAPACDRSGY